MHIAQASIQDFEENERTPVTFTRLCPRATTRSVIKSEILNVSQMIVYQVFEGGYHLPGASQAGEGCQGGDRAGGKLCRDYYLLCRVKLANRIQLLSICLCKFPSRPFFSSV